MEIRAMISTTWRHSSIAPGKASNSRRANTTRAAILGAVVKKATIGVGAPS
jgi:hypothetical protein